MMEQMIPLKLLLHLKLVLEGLLRLEHHMLCNGSLNNQHIKQENRDNTKHNIKNVSKDEQTDCVPL